MDTKKTKEVAIKLRYVKSKVSKDKKSYIGGACLPKYTKELIIDVDDDYIFNLEKDDFEKTGLHSIEISGSNRALKELGKFLINVAMYKTEDLYYHEHIDFIKGSDGEKSVNIIVRKNN